MTEGQWLTCTDPSEMLAFLEESHRASNRKLRLFAVACCRRIRPLLTDARSQASVEVAERFADGLASEQELAAAYRAANEAAFAAEARDLPAAEYAAVYVAFPNEQINGMSNAAAHAVNAVYLASTGEASWHSENAFQCQLLRDLFGHIFQRAAPDERPAVGANWEAVMRVAQSIYREGQFDGMAVLADALEEAGYSDEAILTHCRGPGPHVRGCWVVDLILGKK